MPRRLTFALTGFGPFGDVTANPTQLLLEAPPADGGAAPDPPTSPLLAALPPSLAARVASVTVLPVTLAAARAWASVEAEKEEGKKKRQVNGSPPAEHWAGPPCPPDRPHGPSRQPRPLERGAPC